MAISEKEFEILQAMESQADAYEEDVVWYRPMDLGGYNSSHHSNTLLKLVKKGLVDRKRRYAGISGGSNLYSLNRQGWIALREAWEKRKQSKDEGSK